MEISNKKRNYRLAFAGVTVSLILGFIATKEYQRQELIAYNKLVIASLETEIDAYKDMGLEDSDGVVQATQQRLLNAQQKLNSLSSASKFMFSEDKIKRADLNRAKDLLKINKTMAESYRKEIEYYTQKGMPEDHRAVQFAKENLMKLIIEITALEAKFETQLK